MTEHLRRVTLLKVEELEWTPGPGGTPEVLRLEIFGDASPPNTYRCRVRRYELARTSPPATLFAEEKILLVDWTTQFEGIEGPFTAQSLEEASQRALKFLEAAGWG